MLANQPGTGAGISAAFGKLGATIGSYFFSELKNLGLLTAVWFAGQYLQFLKLGDLRVW